MVRIFEEDAIRRIPVPARTDTYTPVSHGELIDHARDGLRARNLTITSEMFKTDKTGNKLVGYFHYDIDDSRLGGMFSFQNSYDKSMAVRAALGALVLVCTNGMVILAEEAYIKRKHTGGADHELREYIDHIIAEYERVHSVARRDMRNMLDISLDKTAIAHLVGEMYLQEELMTATQLELIKDQMKFSRNFPMVNNQATLWDVYNWTTESYKKSHPVNYLDDHANLHEYVSKKFLQTV